MFTTHLNRVCLVNHFQVGYALQVYRATKGPNHADRQVRHHDGRQVCQET